VPSDILETVSAHPVKSFFVHMLTRDISLQDAVLDLLDNSVDGIQRSETIKTLQRAKPYEGYWAALKFSAESFEINDNCGGIPWKFHEYAFRMGRLKADVDRGRPTVGTYGIGMKRAIFKIGTNCVITTHSKDLSYSLNISKAWMASESNWDLQPSEIGARETMGTRIKVETIHPAIKPHLASSQFENLLIDLIATHFAYIIAKGFKISVNGKPVTPKTIKLLFAKQQTSKDTIRPFVYEAEDNGVDVFLAVGFTSPIPSKEEADESQENYSDRFSSALAGWTVICNDRTVLYCDKTVLTGWGVSGVPQFHPQFTSISGVVIFTSGQPEKLPTTTTKRGIDASSSLYLHVRDKMIEGMKLFTQYTNVWKSRELVAESRVRMKAVDTVEIAELRHEVSELGMTSTKGAVRGKQYKPDLPRPVVTKTTDRISFVRPTKEIRKVSSFLFDSPSREAKVVGEKCFELILDEAGK
jgi:hypothetical protein